MAELNDDPFMPVSGLFALWGLPSYLEADGEASLFGQVELKVVFWYGPGEEGEGVWAHDTSLVFSASSIRLYSDVAGGLSVPTRVFSIATPSELVEKYEAYEGSGSAQGLREWASAVLSEVMASQPEVFRTLAPEDGAEHGFELSKWVPQLGVFTL